MIQTWNDEGIQYLTASKGGSYADVKLADKNKSHLSPLTNFLLNAIVRSHFSRNVIFAFPEQLLKPLPLISYLYMKEEGKSVIAVTEEGRGRITQDPTEWHRRRFFLLMLDNGLYLFQRYPCGLLKPDGVEISPYLPRIGNPRYKRKYLETQQRRFRSKRGPRLLISGNRQTARLKLTIEKLISAGKPEWVSVPLEAGLIIFENADRFAYSAYQVDRFLDWLRPILEADIRVFLHFSNPNHAYLDRFKRELDALLIHIGLPLIRSNEEILSRWKEYVSGFKGGSQEFERLSEFNCDSMMTYDALPSAGIWKRVPSGDLDYHFSAARELISQVDPKSTRSPSRFWNLYQLLLEIHRVLLDPSLYKRRFPNQEGEPRYLRIPQILDGYRNFLTSVDEDGSILIQRILDEIECMYYNVVSHDQSWSHNASGDPGKYRELFEYLRTETSDGARRIICTNSPYERNQIRLMIEGMGPEGVSVFDITQLSRLHFDRSDVEILFFGGIGAKFVTELLRPYKRLLFLAYSGLEERRITEELSVITSSSLPLEGISIRYLQGLAKDLSVRQEDPIVEDFLRRRAQANVSTGTTDSEGDIEITEAPQREVDEDSARTETLLDIIGSLGEDSLLRQELNDAAKIDAGLGSIDSESSVPGSETRVVRVEAVNISDNAEATLELQLTHVYMFVPNEGAKQIEEGYPDELSSGNLLILPRDDVRGSFIDIILEVMGVEDELDAHLLKDWIREMREYIERNGLSRREFHERYRQAGGKKVYGTVGTWVRGRVIGPDNYEDLEILGTVIGDAGLQEDSRTTYAEMEKLRRYRQRAGQKVARIIRAVIEGRVELSELDYEGSLIHQMIERSIYRILEVHVPD